MPRIFVDKTAERGFIRRALAAFPKEYIEAIWGVRRGQDIYVHSFQQLDHTATTGECEYASFEICEDADTLARFEHRCMDGLDLHAEIARENGVRVLGKVHSHPYNDPRVFSKEDDDMPSENDIGEDASEGSIVTGICLIRRHKNGRKYTRIAYWPMLKRLQKNYYE